MDDHSSTIPTPPLTLRLKAAAPSFVVGQSVVLRIEHTVFEPLAMETVELNRARTRLNLLGSDGHAVTLTGEDHVRLYRVSPLSDVGRAFDAPAGQSWTTDLDLFEYTLPLPVGAYVAWVDYRYGDEDTEVVRTNDARFEVVPLAVDSVVPRWFGGDGARDELASACASWSPAARWFFRVAARHDAGLVVREAEVGAVPSARTAPSLAHLNDIAAMHFHRVFTWLEDHGLGWMGVQPRGRDTEPSSIAHGLALDPPPACAEPALQLREGGVAAVVAGRNPSGAPQLTLLLTTGDGLSDAQAYPYGPTFAGHAVVLWNQDESPPSGTAFYVEKAAGEDIWHLARLDLRRGATSTLHSLTEEVVALFIDQWLGRGHLFALTRKASILRVLVWNLDDDEPLMAVRGQVELERFDPPVEGPFSAALWPEGRGVALLFRSEVAWVVTSPEGLCVVPFADLPPHSFASLAVNERRRAWLVIETPDAGPRALRLTFTSPP
jgi:hypothetical protein